MMANRRGSIEWPPRDVTSIKNQLDELVEVVRNYKSEIGVSSNLARLLVVRCCGYVEQTAYEVSRAYVEMKAGGLVRSFARSWLERSRNPSPSNLIELVGRFDSNLSDDFEVFLDADDQRLRRELDFLVDRRNRIAHGLNEGINSPKALDLTLVAVEVADWFILEFDPN